MANLQTTSSPEAVTGIHQHYFEMQAAPRTTTLLGPTITTTTTINNDDNDNDDDNNQVYPAGAKRWLVLSSLIFGAALHGLDLTIIAAAIPSLTNDFHTLDDIGWYSSAYSLMAASFSFVFGRLYTLTVGSGGGTKWTYLGALYAFELD